MAVRPVPEGYHTVTPYIVVKGASKLIDFLKEAFGARIERMASPDGAVMHAEVKIGDSIVMVSDSVGEWKPMPASFYVYVSDTDALYHRALQAGAESAMEPEDKFYGDRNAGVRDPFGNVWWIATHKEDISFDEMQRRAEAFARQKAS